MSNVLALSSIFYGEPTLENWSLAKTAGFNDTELCLTRSRSVEELEAKGDVIHDVLTKAGLAVSSVHLPFGHEWDISSTDTQVREKAVEDYIKLLHWAKGKGIVIAVVHASFEPISDDTRAERLLFAVKSIDKLSVCARTLGMQIAVENLPRSCLGNCAADMLALTGNGETAGICLDSNHLLMETHEEFVPKIARFIITTHLSDYDRLDEKHWLPGEGVINWKGLIGMLAESGYRGRYLFEVNQKCTEPALTAAKLAERFYSLIK